MILFLDSDHRVISTCMYDIGSGKWTLITEDTSAMGGPKLIFNDLFFLQSDFYMYDIGSGKWTLITEDTSAMGGPKLIFNGCSFFRVISTCMILVLVNGL